MYRVCQIFTRLAVLVSVGAGYQLLASTVAVAGPALYFMYDYISFPQGKCMSRAMVVLREAGLSIPEDTKRLGNAQFSIGENSEYTAIIDCSEVSEHGGRVTVMVTTPSNLSEARRLSERLLSGVTFTSQKLVSPTTLHQTD